MGCGPTAKWHNVRIVLGAFLADLEEQWMLLNQKAANSKHPDPRYLVSKSQLTDLRGDYQLRTEAQQRQVCTCTALGSCKAIMPFIC
jgi:hypothetical protein